MGTNKKTEYETEKIARRMAKEVMGSESLWQMFLHDAYQEYYKLSEARGEPTD